MRYYAFLGHSMNNNLLEKIDGVKTKVEQFIDEIRDIFSQTNDEVEKKIVLKYLTHYYF